MTWRVRLMRAILVCILIGIGVRSLPAFAQSDADLRAAFEVASASARSLAAPSNVPGDLSVVGVAVTYRYDGRVVGRGSGFGPDAFMIALSGAVESTKRSFLARYPIAESDLSIAFGPAIAVSVELAATPSDIAIESYLDASRVLDPGRDGIRVLLGERSASAFPGFIRSSGSEPSQVLPSLIERVLDRPGWRSRPLAELLVDVPAFRFQKFSTRQIAQSRSGGPAIVLHRGGRLVEPIMDAERLSDFESRLAKFLDAIPDETLAYAPATHEFTPAGEAAKPLLRVFHTLAEPGAVPDPEDLEIAIPQLRETSNGQGLALYLEAIGTSSLDEQGELRQRLATEMRTLGVGGLATQMPWIGFAAIEIGEDVPVGAPVLREFLALVWLHQVRRGDVSDEDLDLVGGIVFSSRENPLPDWRSAQVLAFAAAATNIPALVSPDERDEHVSGLLEGMRFLEQLSASPAEGHGYVAPAQAMGGIRTAIWNSTMRLDASAITLRALRETIRALEQRSEQP